MYTTHEFFLNDLNGSRSHYTWVLSEEQMSTGLARYSLYAGILVHPNKRIKISMWEYLKPKYVSSHDAEEVQKERIVSQPQFV